MCHDNISRFRWIQVFTRRGLEKNPTLDVKLSLEDRPASGYGVHRPGLSNQEADQVAALLRRVRLFSATEGLIVKVKHRPYVFFSSHSQNAAAVGLVLEALQSAHRCCRDAMVDTVSRFLRGSLRSFDALTDTVCFCRISAAEFFADGGDCDVFEYGVIR